MIITNKTFFTKNNKIRTNRLVPKLNDAFKTCFASNYSTDLKNIAHIFEKSELFLPLMKGFFVGH